MDSKKEIISSEKILIFISLIMIAILIGYNAFYMEKPPEIIKTSVQVEEFDENQNLNSQSDFIETKNDQIININTASEDELTNLNKVGSAVAKRIIIYRETHGGFETIEEIMNVKGIGTKVFENIKNSITV